MYSYFLIQCRIKQLWQFSPPLLHFSSQIYWFLPASFESVQDCNFNLDIHTRKKLLKTAYWLLILWLYFWTSSFSEKISNCWHLSTLCCISLGRCCFGLITRVIIKFSTNPWYSINVDWFSLEWRQKIGQHTTGPYLIYGLVYFWFFLPLMIYPLHRLKPNT